MRHELSGRPPGVYREDVGPTPKRRLPTGVPAFLGYAGEGPVGRAVELRSHDAFRARFGTGWALQSAVGGFFRNGGRVCHVVRLEEGTGASRAVARALEALEESEEIDLVCAPGAFRRSEEPGPGDEDEMVQAQAHVLRHCSEAGTRFAVLDALPGADPEALLRQRSSLLSDDAKHGALYRPWLRVRAGSDPTPPCGHVAGVIARCDERTGVHEPPANEALHDVVDVEVATPPGDLARLIRSGVNCVIPVPGRGIRVWGASTLSGQPAWRWINVRRVVIQARRSLERDFRGLAFEPAGPRLWARARRIAARCLGELYEAGALKGDTPDDAFYVKCDGETNPPGARETGRLVAEVGLAPLVPAEFVIVRLVQQAEGSPAASA